MYLCAELAKLDGLFFQERFLKIFLDFVAVDGVLALFEQAGIAQSCDFLAGEHLVILGRDGDGLSWSGPVTAPPPILGEQ